MLIRYVRENETAQVRDMWCAAFGSDEPYTSWYFQDVYRPERTIAAFQGQQMAASLQLSPYRLRLNGRTVNALYLVGVTTRSEFRNQGVGHQLLRYTLRAVSGGSYQLALLNTDIPAYYAPLGFSSCYYLRRLHWPAQATPRPDGWQQLDAEGDLSQLHRIYTAMCAERQGWVERSPRNWRTLLRDLRCDTQGAIWQAENAYLLCWQEQDTLALRELGYLDAAACREALRLAVALAHEQGCTRVRWDAPEQAPLLKQAGEQRLPYIMARSLDIAPDAAQEDAFRATRQLLGAPRPELWISEIT